MRKIPTLFVRDSEDRKHVLPEVTPGCEWVLQGEGKATRKYDGTCCLIEHAWYDGPQLAVMTRREVKPGKPPPPHFVTVETDSVTGKTFGWEAFGQSGYFRFIEEALGDDPQPEDWPEGTYELVGPKVQGNPEGLEHHVLVAHANADRYPAMDHPQGYDELANVMETLPWEGIVWHHPDGRMVKLKRRDFPQDAAK